MTNHTDGELPEPAGPFDELAATGMDRRTLIKRAAVVGAAFAWSAPAVQVLGARPAFAQTGTPPPPEGEPECCPEMTRGTLFFQWNSQTCTQNPGTRIGRKTGNVLYPSKPCRDNSSCGNGTVYVCAGREDGGNHEGIIFLNPGGTDWNGGGPWGGNTWQCPHGGTGIVLNINQQFAISSPDRGNPKVEKDFALTVYTTPNPASADAYCQQVVMHISCSDKALQGPTYRYGGFVFYDFRHFRPADAKCSQIKD